MQSLPQRGAPPTDAHTVELVAILRRIAAGVRGGRADWIRGVADPYVYLSEDARRPPHHGKLLQAIRHARIPGVADVLDVGWSAAGCRPSQNERTLALVCRSLPAPDAATGNGPRRGDLYVVVEHASFFDPRYVRGHGASHGSPYLYDRAVPLLV